MSNQFDFDLDDKPEKSPSIAKKALAGMISAFFWLPRKLRIVLSIIAVAAAFIAFLFAFKPEAKKRPIPETVVKVDVVKAIRSSYPIIVNSNGTIQADTRGNLVSQIRGEIVQVSDKFKTGGAFEKGDVLIQLDQRDYLADSSQAAAAVSQAQVAHSQEQANAKQAANDWKRLGNVGSPPDLVARKPQLAASKAQLESANARYQTAQLNLERTNIKAPYTGRVIRRDAVLGQYVGIGTVLAEVFATDGVEARLPLSLSEYSQLGLDSLGSTSTSAEGSLPTPAEGSLLTPAEGSSNKDKIALAKTSQFTVVLSAQLGINRYTWDAVVTRTDSTFNLNTRQIDIIATVIDPFGKDPKNRNKPPLKIGQFVNATIQGRTIDNIMVVPNKAIREGSYVFVSEDLKLVRKPVTIAWQDDQNALIENGLDENDLVVITSLNSTLAGAKVKLSDDVVSDQADKTNESESATVDEQITGSESDGDTPTEETTQAADSADSSAASKKDSPAPL